MNTKWYNEHSEIYCKNTENIDMTNLYALFLPYIKLYCSILDAGCGSGRDSLYFLNSGYNVTSIDASEKMINEAKKRNRDGNFFVKEFQNISWINQFDAIWANASLLHMDDENIKISLEKFFSALKKDGLLFFTMKEGNEQKYIDERFYNFVSIQKMTEILKTIGYTILISQENDDLNGKEQKWITFLAKK